MFVQNYRIGQNYKTINKLYPLHICFYQLHFFQNSSLKNGLFIDQIEKSKK